MATPRPARARLIWGAVLLAIATPLAASLMSPLLAWRQPVYIAAGIAGVLGLGLLLVQPLLALGVLPGAAGPRGRRAHRWTGAALAALVVAHVAGLWITSPPDVIDVLLFRSPTPFSVWGAIAMWAVFAAALMAALRRRLRWPALRWRRVHAGLAAVIVTGTIVHAVQITGTMEPITKALLAGLVALATGAALVKALRR